jgi:hypothetical protein
MHISHRCIGHHLGPRRSILVRIKNAEGKDSKRPPGICVGRGEDEFPPALA